MEPRILVLFDTITTAVPHRPTSQHLKPDSGSRRSLLTFSRMLTLLSKEGNGEVEGRGKMGHYMTCTMMVPTRCVKVELLELFSVYISQMIECLERLARPRQRAVVTNYSSPARQPPQPSPLASPPSNPSRNRAPPPHPHALPYQPALPADFPHLGSTPQWSLLLQMLLRGCYRQWSYESRHVTSAVPYHPRWNVDCGLAIC